MKTVNERWKQFEKAVLPKQCSDIQRSAMKRAFFAGASIMLGVLTDEITELSEEEGCAAITSMVQQCRGFAEAVKLGSA